MLTDAVKNVTILLMRLISAPPTSTISWYFAVCYSAVIVIVSLYPFTGWRITGIPLLDFYTYALPYYYTVFDNTANLIAYIPLGFAIALSTKKRWLGLMTALCGGALLSGSIEFVQQFLPTRIASNLDIFSNTTGALIGAIGALIIPWQPIQHYLRIRHMWLRSSQWVDMGMVWLVLWLLTQFNPVEPLFSMVNTISDLPQPIDSPLASPTIFLMLLEISSVFLHIVSLALFASCLVRPRRAMAPIIWLTFALGFLGKITATITLLKPVQFFTWLDFNVLVGGGTAIWVLTLLLHLSSRTRALIGCITLLLSLLVSWSWPISPSFSAIFRLFDWTYGYLFHFSGLANVIRELWPYGALVILLGIARRYH
jgi:VanZ family protein